MVRRRRLSTELCTVKLLLPVRWNEDRWAIGSIRGGRSTSGLGVDAARGMIARKRVLVLVVVRVLMGVLVVLYLVLVLRWVLVGVLVGMRMVAVGVLDKITRRLGALWIGRVLASARSERVGARPRRRRGFV